MQAYRHLHHKKSKFFFWTVGKSSEKTSVEKTNPSRKGKGQCDKGRHVSALDTAKGIE